MAITIELPPSLEAELAAEAALEGLSTAENACLYLCLGKALVGEGQTTSIRESFKALLVEQSSANRSGWRDVDRILNFLQVLREGRAHTTIYLASDQSPSAVKVDGAEASEPLPVKRPSAKGICAHLGGGTEEFMREKQLEIEREDGKLVWRTGLSMPAP